MHKPQGGVQDSQLSLERKQLTLYLFLHFLSYHALCCLYFVYMIEYKENYTVL